MFGFSITKLVFTIVIVVVVWQAFKYFTRLSDQREDRARMADKKANKNTGRGADASPPGVEDMVKCSVCDSYVARGSQSCGKEGCPFRG